MKQIHYLLAFFFISNTLSAANKYWVGPLYGNWSTSAYWSFTNGGTGGAGAPGSSDDVKFTGTARIKMDVSPAVHSINTNFGSGKVLLIASIPTTITVLGSLIIEPLSYIKDSTSADVPFDVTFKPGATATIQGDWIFEGGGPVSGSGGPSFTAPVGTLVKVSSTPSMSSGGRIICNINSKPIVSTTATLSFEYYSYYISDNILTAVIPAATWAKDSVSSIAPYGGTLGAPASTIMLSDNLRSVHYLGGIPKYGRMVINLPTLDTDISLALPDGSKIRGNLEILNTNNHNLVLLTTKGTSKTGVHVEIGTNEAGSTFGGFLKISGTSRVALARASAHGINFSLTVDKDFNQSGGNFSLQDDDLATGSSTLDIKNNLVQTGGTFLTNSTSTSPLAKFMVVMDDPVKITGPSGDFESSRTIKMSDSTIDNPQKMVTLRINHSVYSIPGYLSDLNGVILKSPLIVGRLELVKGPLTTSTTNVLIVEDPSINAVTAGSSNSYVNGPLIRATNAALPYVFPTGQGNTAVSGYHFDSCIVVPVSSAVSVYQAQYFNSEFIYTTTLSPLQGVSTNKYWYISRLSGADAKVTLILNGPVTGATSTKGIVVAYAFSGKWIKENGTIKTPGTSTTGSVTSTILSSFGYFTFGYGVPALLGPIIMINGPVTSTNAAGNVESASAMDANISEPAIYPNPFMDNFTMDFYNPGSTNITLNIYDLKGSLVQSEKLSGMATGKNTVRINVADKNMPAANYVAQLKINGVVTNTMKLLKAK